MSSMPYEPTALSRRSTGKTSAGGPAPAAGETGRAAAGTTHRPEGSRAAPEPGLLAKVIPLPVRRHGAVRHEDREAGMATAEYAIATLAAVAFAALLVAVLSSGDVRDLLMSLIRAALSFG